MTPPRRPPACSLRDRVRALPAAVAPLLGGLAVAAAAGLPIVASAGTVATTATPSTEAAAAVEYEGYPIERSARVADTVLVLNGYGKRLALAIYKPYSAALYLTRRVSTGAALMADAGPKRLQLRMLVSGSSKYFVEAFDKGIQKRVPEDQRDAMSDRVKAFDDVLAGMGDLKKGDVVNLDYVPGKGTTFMLNGQPRGAAIPGADLYNAMLSIFAGDRALDKPLSAALLGGAPN